MQSRSYDVIVVGAGIVGAACADELVRRGMTVCLLDRQGTASGATSAGMGHVVVMDDSEAQFALTRYSQALWRTMRAELPEDVEFEQCGTIWVAADEEEMAEVRRKHEFYGARGVPTDVLDARALKNLEPNLRDGLVGGLLVSGDVVLNPPAATKFFVERAQARGAELRFGASVKQVREGYVVLSDGTELRAGIIVNAAGAWAPEVTPCVDIRKRKGHLAITAAYPNFAKHQLVELGYLKSAHSIAGDSVAFNIQPKRWGQVLIGSSRQYDAEHEEVDQDIVEKMMQRAQEYMPAIAHMSIVHRRCGFRAATPDNLPLIGPWTGDKSVWLATGHEGLGITTSLATAKILADQITGVNPEIPVEPYWPSRTMQASAHPETEVPQ